MSEDGILQAFDDWYKAQPIGLRREIGPAWMLWNGFQAGYQAAQNNAATPQPAVPNEILALADRCCESYGEEHHNMTIYKLASFIRSISAAPTPPDQSQANAEAEESRHL